MLQDTFKSIDKVLTAATAHWALLQDKTMQRRECCGDNITECHGGQWKAGFYVVGGMGDRDRGQRSIRLERLVVIQSPP